jgi:endonuclease YncB( thermonuclease family)
VIEMSLGTCKVLVMRLIFALPLTLLMPELGLAHGGGLNAEGCHNDRKNGGYHCHRSPTPRASARPSSLYQAQSRELYANCTEARDAGAAPLYRGTAGYSVRLDRDQDGVACENSSSPSSQTISRSAPVRALSVPLVAAATSLSKALVPPIEGKAQVLDGDTIQIGTTRIRLYGIDAFEAEQRCTNSEEESYTCGGEATRTLSELVADQEVSCVSKGKDAFSRVLAVCRVSSTDLSAAMARSGHALAYTKYSLDYVSDERAAKRQLAGAWSGSFELPWEFRISRPSGAAEAQRSAIAPSANCTIKGNVSKKAERIYHLKTDPSYARTKPENWFCSVEEAEQAGFRPVGSQ